MIIEKPVVFGRSSSLIGMECGPAGGGRPSPFPRVVLLNSGILHRVGPNRLYVQIARALARKGIWSLRFDLGGIGDSSIGKGEAGTVLDFVRRDISDALDRALEPQEASGIVVMGLCSGADNALHTAVRDPRVVGAVLIDPNTHRPASFFFHHYWARLSSRRTWEMILSGQHPAYRLWVRRLTGNPELSGQDQEAPFLAPAELPSRTEINQRLQGLLARRCRLLYVFTGGLNERYNHRKQLYRSYPALRGSPLVSLEYYPDSDHTFSQRKHQRRLVETIVSWTDTWS